METGEAGIRVDPKTLREKKPTFVRRTGRFFGKHFLNPIEDYLRRKVEKFDINVSGIENLKDLKSSYILVANHIKPEGFISQQTGTTPDAFILEELVLQETGCRVRIIAQGDSGQWWFENEKLRGIQKKLEQYRAGALEETGAIPINKNPGRVNVSFFKSISKVIQGGEPFLIFPEGDWHEDFSRDNSLQGGAAHLAKKYNLPIVPAYIGGAVSWKPGTKVNVAFGAPFETNDMSIDQINDFIKQKISELQDLFPKP